MASLCLLDDDGLTAALWELGEKPIAVGRGEAVEVRVSDVTLSRRHFVIVRDGAAYRLEDLASQNGTYVAGKRAAPSVVLRHHDCIAAGRSLFLFSDRAQGHRTPASLPRA